MQERGGASVYWIRDRLRWLWVASCMAWVLAGCHPGARPPTSAEEAWQRLPEPATVASTGGHGRFARHAVAAAHPLAAQAGLEMLRRGGNALDAAIAAQWVLGVVEPQSSGLGGGGFLLWWDGRQVHAWDGRETAPSAATATLFQTPQGKPLPFGEAVASGLSVGVPGLVPMLAQAHAVHGRLTWAELFDPAIQAAEQGVPVGPRLHALLALSPHLRRDPQALAHFHQPLAPGEAAADARPWPVGHVLRNPAQAHVLRRLAREGPVAWSQGPVAEAIVGKVRSHPRHPGALVLGDLAGYQPVRRQALCTPWLVRYQVCGFPPPSSGHLAIQQILGIAAGHLGEEGPPAAPDAVSADLIYTYTEAARLAFADRARYVADPDHVAPPGDGWTSMLDPDYLRQRARLIGPLSLGTAVAGVPPGSAHRSGAPQPEQPERGTTHLSVVDAEGRGVAMTSSIEAAFGSGLMVDGGSGLPGGFLLNNQLTDFSFVPVGTDGQPVANRVAPGKRPRSSMAPTLVLDRDGRELTMSLGSPGGAAIIHFVARSLLATLAWGWSPWEAVQAPNFGSFNGSTWLESDRFPPHLTEALRRRGQQVQGLSLPSGIQIIQRRGQAWEAAADPRREGAVRGD